LLGKRYEKPKFYFLRHLIKRVKRKIHGWKIRLHHIDLKTFVLWESDERGDRWKLTTTDGHEYFLSYTVRDEVRGGYTPPTNLYCWLIDGRLLWIIKVCLTCPPEHGVKQSPITAPLRLTNKKETPYMYVAIGESAVTLEFLKQPKWKARPFPEFQELVEQPIE